MLIHGHIKIILYSIYMQTIQKLLVACHVLCKSCNVLFHAWANVKEKWQYFVADVVAQVFVVSVGLIHHKWHVVLLQVVVDVLLCDVEHWPKIPAVVLEDTLRSHKTTSADDVHKHRFGMVA